AVEATPAPPQVRASDSSRPAPSERGGRLRQRLVWIGLAFAPSSLLLGTTEYITTDIASVPLFWVVPLAAYLASFVVAFAKRQPIKDAIWSRALALTAGVVALLFLGQVRTPTFVIAG